MEQELIRNLRACGEAFAAARGIVLTTVGKLIARDTRFFERLEEGKTITMRKYDEVMDWFSANFPEDAAWPADVPRPHPAEAAKRIAERLAEKDAAA